MALLAWPAAGLQKGDQVDDSLQKLLDEGVIDDIRARLMSGKEASVYVVERKGELIAAKVYKDREQRTFKATASYTEGRNQTRNTRDKRAMNKRTTYGRELMEKSWRDMEFEALSQAFHAGVRVPEPILLYDDVLLMQLLVDEQGNPAPRLAEFELPADVATLLHREVYGQVRLLLMCGKIHGDLSAYNVLIAEAGPTIIDMPQVVDAAANNSAAEILRRDLCNVTEHLARFDPTLLRFRDCGLALFQHWQRGTIEQAIDPLEGALRGRSDRRQAANRVERGPWRDDRGPPQQRQDQRPPPRHDQRGPPPQQRQGQRYDQRDQRGPPPQQRQDQRHDQRGPPPQQRQDQRHDQRGPPPQQRQDQRYDQRDQRGPPPQQRQDQRHDQRDQRGPPPQQRQDQRHDQRGPPPQQRQDQRYDQHDQQRGPPQRPDARGPRRDP
jgi:RIO kinase 1